MDEHVDVDAALAHPELIDSLRIVVPDTVPELLGEKTIVVAPAPAVAPSPVPVASPVFDGPVDESDDERVQLTGSDYAFYALMTAGAVGVVGVVSVVGYVIYALVTSIFGAVASGAALAAGAFPLLVLVGVVMLCARGRGGARAGGVSLPGVGGAAPRLLGGVGSIAMTVAGPIPGALGRRRARSQASRDAGVEIGFEQQPVRRSRWRSAAPALAPVVSVTPRSLSRRAADGALGRFRVGRALGFGAPAVQAAPVGVAAASPTLLGRVFGTPTASVTASGAVLGAPYRGPVRSFLMGGAGSAPVVPGVAPQGRFSRLMFGDFSPTAQLAAVIAGRPLSTGVVGWVTGGQRRAAREPAAHGHGQSSPAAFDYSDSPGAPDVSDSPLDFSSDVLIEDLVGLGRSGGLTKRWISRLVRATPNDQVFGSWRVKSGGKCRYCAVGFLWDEMDPDGWYSVGRGRYLHRDIKKSFEMYGIEFLWNISNMYEARVWSLKDCAAHVQREVGAGAK